MVANRQLVQNLFGNKRGKKRKKKGKNDRSMLPKPSEYALFHGHWINGINIRKL